MVSTPAMDEKTTNMLPVGRSPATRRSRMMIAVALFGTLCLYMFYQVGFPACRPRTDSWLPKTQAELTQTGNTLVPLEAHIMSKCPDARVRFDTHG
jgi:hypothetical protein